jgi:hypothetical protein
MRQYEIVEFYRRYLKYLFCRNIRETLASKGLMLLEWLKKPRFYTKKLYWY